MTPPRTSTNTSHSAKAVPAAKKLELLFEIGAEEIPAGMLPRAEEELKVIIEKLLTTENLTQGVTVETFAAPRRLIAWVRGLPAKQEDVVSEVTGPPKSVAYDAQGQPTRAAVSFAEKQGIRLVDVYIVQTPKGEYLAAKHTKRGRTSEQILAEMLPRAIHDLTWPRTMTWTGLDGARFIRPIRWIVATLDGKPFHFTFGGIPAGNVTRGHRFLGSSAIRSRPSLTTRRNSAPTVSSCSPPIAAPRLKKNSPPPPKRGGYKLHQDPELLKLVVYLNEFPSVIEGSFDEKFLSLPDEILITVMRDHQKYFALERKNGELAPKFPRRHQSRERSKGLVAAGHERVLRARFADAQFFWASDQKCRLADYLPKLAKVTYESRLGSYADKVERIRDISRWLVEHWTSLDVAKAHVADADRAAELAKCDLACRNGPRIHRTPGHRRRPLRPRPRRIHRRRRCRLRSLSPRRPRRPHPAQRHRLRRLHRRQTRLHRRLLRRRRRPHRFK